MVKTIEESGYMFKFFNFLFEFFTYGYIAEIIFFFLLFFIVLLILFLCMDYIFFKYILKDKLFFMGNYLFYFGAEKKNFIKSYLRVIKYYIIEYKFYILIFVIVLCIVYLIAGYLIRLNHS